jgi:hypothetical protein
VIFPAAPIFPDTASVRGDLAVTTSVVAVSVPGSGKTTSSRGRIAEVASLAAASAGKSARPLCPLTLVSVRVDEAERRRAG